MIAERRSVARSGALTATKTKAGRNIPSVASPAPAGPARRYPQKAAVLDTGPGVPCPAATASRSWRSVSQPRPDTSSVRRNAIST